MSRQERSSGELRALLRDWAAPSPPPEIEDDLRRTFRGRNGARGRRPLLWLGLAAAVAFAAVLQWDRMTPAVPPSPSPPVSPRYSSPPPGPAAPLTETVSGPRVAEAQPSRPPAPPRGSSSIARTSPPVAGPESGTEEAVVVEAGQAALLAALGVRLQGGISPGAGGPVPAVGAMPEDANGAGIQSMPKTEVPAYQSLWETRADEWPRVERPAGGR